MLRRLTGILLILAALTSIPFAPVAAHKPDVPLHMAPGWMTTATWALTFVLGWLLVAQLGLAAQGLDLLSGRREAK